MPKILKPRPEHTVGGYEPIPHEGACPLNRGAIANAYRARSRHGGEVFLKQYKEPVESDEWYRDYIRYEQEKRRRIEGSPAASFCVAFVDLFESDEVGPTTYYQAFEFIEDGDDLKGVLERLRGRPAPETWKSRLLIAKAMCAAIRALHDIDLVHCDLKPENVQLIEAPGIVAGYKTKLIDLDRSILVDRPAPWHAHGIGHVGTPNYHSPEHLGGLEPQKASDVFTCGLILYELLTDRHPYWEDEQEDYKAHIDRDSPPRPRLLLDFAKPRSTQAVEQVLQRCLAKNPSERPTMDALLKTLQEAGGGVSKPPRGDTRPPVTPPPPPAPPRTDTPAPPETRVAKLRLEGEDGSSRTFGITTAFGKGLAQAFETNPSFVASTQFHLEREADAWFVRPDEHATNATLLNGAHLTSRTRLSEGDVLAVGRADGSVQKMPLTVRLGDEG